MSITLLVFICEKVEAQHAIKHTNKVIRRFVILHKNIIFHTSQLAEGRHHYQK